MESTETSTEAAATMDDVRTAYRLLLGREPDAGGLAHYGSLLERGKVVPSDIARHLVTSDEFNARYRALRGFDTVAQSPAKAYGLHCQACTQAQVESSIFRHWAEMLGEVPGLLHRKLWEWCFITEALHERGMLRSARRGLGFAVGTEPLTALFVKLGCAIVASDVGEEIARREGWVTTNQHANGYAQLNQRGLCPVDQFAERAQFREVDMRAIPADLRGFDFLWSSCALEHLGSLQAGADYVVHAMACLRPGGVAVHTTELNCDSDTDTVETGGSVIYREHDLLALAARLRADGHHVAPFDFNIGTTNADLHVEESPYTGSPQLKLRLGSFASTSFGIIVTKGAG